VERPAAEGEEASKMNGHSGAVENETITATREAKLELAWQEKIHVLTAQQDKM
jgi:hypothetical protein